MVKKGEVDEVGKTNLLDEVYEIAGVNYKIDNFILRGVKNGKTIGNLSKIIIIRELRNVTTTATEVARALDKGKIKLLKLDEVDFITQSKIQERKQKT
ncbi:hypothetical protein [Tenacibaculum maritimum]|uniref:hypothetical protein n=1 Tax=Tenacibaculum maritimum TaxID=107401 RepID=UPI00133005FD|nr:hypothetical protein [Tenacibaculum maritimum]